MGLEAQEAAIRRFAEREEIQITGWYREIESAKRVSDTLSKRPQLAAAALKEARDSKVKIFISRLDRLSRDVHFISGLMREREGVPFVVCELGLSVDAFYASSVCVFSRKRARAYFSKDARGVVRSQGPWQKIRWPSAAESSERAYCPCSSQGGRDQGSTFERYSGPGISLRGIARRLTNAGCTTSRGSEWTATAVSRAINRLGLKR